jgi:DNA-directed RNA polymerase specialized sigma24 family protein
VNGVAPARAFEQWYAGEHPRLFASLLVLTGDRDVAADATDEALSRALQHWARVAEMESPEGWTYRVAVNIVRRGARRRALERRLLPRLVGRQTTAAPPGDVWDLVRSLTKRQQQALVLRYIADLAESDIAAVMGVTRGTVASTLADARRRLGDALREPDVAEETT